MKSVGVKLSFIEKVPTQILVEIFTSMEFNLRGFCQRPLIEAINKSIQIETKQPMMNEEIGFHIVKMLIGFMIDK